MYLVMDFETRSRVDLSEVSYQRYAADPSTDIMCIGLKWEGRPASVFVPTHGAVLDGRTRPIEVMEAIRIGCPIVVHNRTFEENIYYHICVLRFGWPEIHPDQWHDTMASCSYYAVPRSLEKAGKALGLTAQKMIVTPEFSEEEEPEPKPEGKRKRKPKKEKPKSRHVLKQVCKPRVWSAPSIAKWIREGNREEDLPIRWWDDKPRLHALYEYCKADVESQDELYRTLGPLPPARLAEWRLDCRINSRGLPVDWPSLHTVSSITGDSLSWYNDRVRKLTATPAYPEGMIQTLNQNRKILDWIEMMGTSMTSLDKAAVIDALALNNLSNPVREMLTIKQDAGKSSLGKLQTMLDQTDLDSRIRDSLVWHGAATGRKAGRGIQPQNIPNDCLKGEDLDEFYRALADIDPAGKLQELSARIDRSLPDLVSGALRSFICAEPGKKFLISDLSNIETRNLAWVSGCRLLTEAFATGQCPYKQFAGMIYNIPDPQNAIDKKAKERVLGKVSVLALGYSMGADKFQITAAGPLYQIQLGMTQANEIKDLYRRTYYEVPAYWASCEEAFREAITNRTTVQNGRVSFGCNGTWGWIVLPSGRPIWFYRPQVARRPNRFREGSLTSQIVYMGIDSVTKQWRERSTYGGSIVESICQGMAGCLLQEICFRSEAAGYPVVLTVHDEIVSEVPEHYPVEPFHQIVKTRPAWCLDLPIECETHEAKRYGK